MAADTVQLHQCSSLSGKWRHIIKSTNSGKLYTVKFEPTPEGDCEMGFTCTCKGFQFRGTCSHIRQAEKHFCGWHQQFHGGEPDNGKCPNCGSSVEAVMCAV